jgi:TRAP-type transport system periplasmic protein
VQKFLTVTNHAYLPIVAAMNKGKFDGMPPAHQQVIVDQHARRRPTTASST